MKKKKAADRANRISTFYLAEDGNHTIKSALERYVADSGENASVIVRKLLKSFLKRKDYM